MAPMSNPTVFKARSAKRDLEQAIIDEISEYEKEYGVIVDRVRLTRDRTPKGGSKITNVEVEVQL